MSGDGDFRAEVDVLDGVKELDAFAHGTLKSFAAGDESCAASALVDDGGGDSFLKIVGAGSAAGVDEAGAAHVAVGDLIAREVDGVIAAEIGVDALIKFAVTGIADVECGVSAIIFGELLLDDVGLDGDAEMIGLAGEVGGNVVVLVFLEGVVAEIAPEDGGHPELMSAREGLRDFNDLAAALIRAEIDGRAHGGGAHVVSLLYGAEQYLIGSIGESEEFIVVDLHDEGNFVRVLPSDRAEYAEGGSNGIAAAFDGELDDVAAVEVVGIFGEAGAAGMLDALVYGKNREVAGTAETSVAEHALEIGEYANVAVR